MKRKYPATFDLCTIEEVSSLALLAFERIARRRISREKKREVKIKIGECVNVKNENTTELKKQGENDDL